MLAAYLEDSLRLLLQNPVMATSRLRKVRHALMALAVSGLSIASPAAVEACTSFILKEKGGGFVYARTFEYGNPLYERIALFPRKFQYKGSGPTGVAGSGLNWTGKYGVIGVNGFGIPFLIDGMNEKGLTGGMLNAPTTAVFQNPTGQDAKNSVASYQVLLWILSQFSSISEVKASLPALVVNSSALPQFGGQVRIHITLHDVSGQSIVVEFLNGKTKITDNPSGVLANDPPIDWHFANLANYLNLSPFDKAPITVQGQTFTPQSIGSGLHGLPGDYMSPSRFVRAFFFSQAAQKYADSVPKVKLAWHIINAFDIPPGSAITATQQSGKTPLAWDYTQATVVADAKNLIYYARSFDGFNVSKVDLKRQNFDGTQMKMWDLDRGTTYQDVR